MKKIKIDDIVANIKEKDMKIRTLNKTNKKLSRENENLKKEVEKLQEKNEWLALQIKEYQEKFFKKKKKKKNEEEEKEEEEDDDDKKQPKKRGAKKGHPGTTRKIPNRIDKHEDIHLYECPCCNSKDISKTERFEDHYQEDIIIIPQTVVTRYRHYFYYCKGCGEIVYGSGENEIPSSYIGPVAKSIAIFLHYQMAMPYRKIQILFKEFFNMEFVPSSCPGFDRQARVRGKPLYKQLKELLKKQNVLHMDETGWKFDGDPQWLWTVANENMVVYKIDKSRGNKVIESMLGKEFNGVLISDFLGAYNKIKSRKQRCLVHLLRLIKKWIIYFDEQKKIKEFLLDLKFLIKSIIKLSESMKENLPEDFTIRKADLVGQLRRKLDQTWDNLKMEKFRKRLLKHFEELITCLDFAEVCSHNNLAERILRGNVIMRKITFGNRSDEGRLNHEVLMSLIETAKIKNINPFSFLLQLFNSDKKNMANLAALLC